jgi:malonyl-CoA O-methyltransferase
MRLTYRQVPDLMRDLKTLGAHNSTSGRHRGMTGKTRLQAMIDAYEAFRSDGLLPASYEVVYGHAWAQGQPRQQELGRVPLDSLLGGR